MNLVVIGAQWGDEGKGKIVDFLASQADLTVRFSGGANAGHTIVAGETTYKLHLIPSGIISPGRKVLLGTGMVIDPEALFEELNTIAAQGIGWSGRVLVSDRAHIVLPAYKKQDKDLDGKRKKPIGTTGRGIGITYAMKANRDGIRVIDMYDEELVAKLLPEDRAFLMEYRGRMKDMTVNAAAFMREHREAMVLFEGAQGALLDLDSGTYPFVSSGVSSAAGASSGGSVGPRHLDKVLGVFKAYSTRVGNGPFPTEFLAETEDELCRTVRTVGREYGVTTGRPRRCGVLDLVALKYSCWINSIDELVLTHPDVYDGMETLRACTAYDIGGRRTEDFPSSCGDLDRAAAVTRTFPGWMSPIGNCRRWEDLPDAARRYIEFIEAYVQTPVTVISVGPERDQTILRRNPWTRSS